MWMLIRLSSFQIYHYFFSYLNAYPSNHVLKKMLFFHFFGSPTGRNEKIIQRMGNYHGYLLFAHPFDFFGRCDVSENMKFLKKLNIQNFGSKNRELSQWGIMYECEFCEQKVRYDVSYRYMFPFFDKILS